MQPTILCAYTSLQAVIPFRYTPACIALKRRSQKGKQSRAQDQVSPFLFVFDFFLQAILYIECQIAASEAKLNVV